ncbi:MAG: DUF167 domain-containing protein [Caldisericota bacterium]|nr:DUF167 domain-containing protein [Caldisericota bacterium]
MRIPIHVTTGSREAAIVPGSPLHVRVKARPVDGRANGELVCLLGRYYGVRQDAVRIVAGLTAREKIIEIVDVDQQRRATTRGHRGVAP